MPSVRRTTSLPLALVVGVLVVDGVAATPAVAAGQSPAAAAVPQETAAGEASLALDRSTRRMIQQGLRNEGFDPGTPDGLFGSRTRAAIRDWQQSRGAAPTGYLTGADAELLRTSAAPPPALAGASPSPQPDSAVQPSAVSPFDPRPAVGATAPAQLPPDILLDSYLLRAEESVRTDDRAAALAAMEQIDALQAEHHVDIPADHHFRYARVWTSLANWERSQASAVRYLDLTGRASEHYLDALTLMNRAIDALEDLARERDRLAAEDARRRAAAARDRAALERAVDAARAVIAEMEFVPIPAGQFTMGTDSPDDVFYYHRPATAVRLTRPFEIGRYEVTQDEWERVMGSNPSEFPGCARCPVERLTWDEIHQFISTLNAADGDAWAYRLPTEAEWEYAARAGTTEDRYVTDIAASAWCPDNSDDRPHPVGLKRPNAFGIYDMLGNVQEVVSDWLGTYPGGTVADPIGPSWPTLNIGIGNPDKVTRGGNYLYPQSGCAFAERSFFNMETNGGGGIRGAPWTGFRLVRTAFVTP